MAVATGTAILASAALAAGATAYTTDQQKKAAEDAKWEAEQARKKEQQKIQARQQRIEGMRTRLYETEGGIFGEDVKKQTTSRKNFLGN